MWGAAVLVAFLLYLVRRRPRHAPITTLAYFKTLARAHQETHWLRRLKRLLSLLLTLLALGAGVAVIARLVMAPPRTGVASVVLLVDRSGSMGVRDKAGRTRLSEGIHLARERLSRLPAAVPVAVVAYDQRPRVLLPSTTQRRHVDRILGALQARPIEGHRERALVLARQIAGLAVPAEVWHVTDDARPARGRPAGASASAAISTIVLDTALQDVENAGITAAEIRKLPLEANKFEAFVQIRGRVSQPAEAQLDICVDNVLSSVRKLSLAPERSCEQLLIPLDAAAGQEMSLFLSLPGDALDFDDRAYLRLPALEPLTVLWVTPAADPFTALALQALEQDGSIRVFHGDAGAWPSQEHVDVAVFDGLVPEQCPDSCGTVLINPPASMGKMRVEPLSGSALPLPRVRPLNSKHPLLYGVASDRVSVTQTAVLDVAGLLETLWTGAAGPVLCAGEVGSQRLVVMAFSPGQSEHLPLMASFPMLLGNAINWTGQSGAMQLSGNNRRTGALVRADATPVRWRRPQPGGESGVLVDRPGRWCELERVGFWEAGTGESGTASMLSSAETMVPARAAAEPNAGPASRTSHASLFRGDLAAQLKWLMLLVLLLESWLFHRHAVY